MLFLWSLEPTVIGWVCESAELINTLEKSPSQKTAIQYPFNFPFLLVAAKLLYSRAAKSGNSTYSFCFEFVIVVILLVFVDV